MTSVRTAIKAGDRFGCLTIICDDGLYRGFRAYLAKCDCGLVVRRPSITVSRTNRENCGEGNCKLRKPNGKKHGCAGPSGKTATLTYKSWRNMIKRCTQRKAAGYQLYGGRGIKIHPAWREFENFLRDMGERKDVSLTLERKDTNGNYEPGNCVWATQKVQQNNRRNNRSNNPYV